LLLRRGVVDVLEICSDHYLGFDAAELAELDALADVVPLLPHGLNLSIASADGLDLDYVSRLAALLERVRPPWYSDHLAFTRIGSREVGHLVAPPRTLASVEAVERNVAMLRARIGDVPFALENVACSFEWPDSDFEPGPFVAEILRRTDCALVLDVANLYGDAFNLGHDPRAFVDAIPPERIVQVHVAGGHHAGEALIDSHSQPTPEPVWELLAYVIARARGAGVSPPVTIVEREAALPPLAVLAREVARARAMSANVVSDANPTSDVPVTVGAA
jgi:uncharacterized protein (UPF0276 family)